MGYSDEMKDHELNGQSEQDYGIMKVPHCPMIGFAYISIFAVTITSAMLFTHLLHEPFQRWYNGKFLQKAPKAEVANAARTRENHASMVQVDPTVIGRSMKNESDDLT